MVSYAEGTSTPRTAGELRRVLSEMGNPWAVDPRLNDDDPLPDYPRGGQLEEDIPQESSLEPMAPTQDIDALLREVLPTNVDLRQRWAEVGLLGTVTDQRTTGTIDDTPGGVGDEEVSR